jgi:hypothetical protein
MNRRYKGTAGSVWHKIIVWKGRMRWNVVRKRMAGIRSKDWGLPKISRMQTVAALGNAIFCRLMLVCEQYNN